MLKTRKQAHMTLQIRYKIKYFVHILDIVDRSEMSKTRKRAHMLKKKVLQAGTSLGTSKPDKDRGGCHRDHRHRHRHCCHHRHNRHHRHHRHHCYRHFHHRRHRHHCHHCHHRHRHHHRHLHCFHHGHPCRQKYSKELSPHSAHTGHSLIIYLITDTGLRHPLMMTTTMMMISF